MTSLALAMIMRDEQESIGRILEHASTFCDQLVVVDTGSVDDSVAIAKGMGAEVHHFEWIYDFAAARNYSFEQCSADWIVWLDADDVVTPDAQAAYREAKTQLLSDDIDGVYAPYLYTFLPGTDVCTLRLHRERLIRRASGLRWNGAIHEVIPLFERPNASSDALYIEHRPSQTKLESKGDRNLVIIQRMVDSGDQSARTMFYYGNELRDRGRYTEALTAYKKYIAQGGPEWEMYHARLFMSDCELASGNIDAAVGQAMTAIRQEPSRAEAYLRAGRVYYDRQEWARAAPLFSAACAGRRPELGFVDDPDYSYLPWDYLSICLGQLGKFDEAIAAGRRSLELGNPDGDRISGNIAWWEQQQGPSAPPAPPEAGEPEPMAGGSESGATA
jgi:glycosyltransferase involved in cell wall biosynthesis